MQKRRERKISPIPAPFPHSPPNTSNVFAVLNLASIMFSPAPGTCVPTRHHGWRKGQSRQGWGSAAAKAAQQLHLWKHSPTHPSRASQTNGGRGRGEQTCFQGRQFAKGQLRGRVTEPSWQLAPAGKDGAASSLSLPAPHRAVSPLFPQLISCCSLSGALVFHKPLLFCEPEERKSIYLVSPPPLPPSNPHTPTTPGPPRLAFCGMVR